MERLRTVWGETFDAKHVLPEYPRPAMKRESFYNLNGYWEYAFTKKCVFPKSYEGKIVVPFSPESVLSGVGRQLKPNEYLWYRRFLPKIKKEDYGKRILLHFGAVDQACRVWINRKFAGHHEGGYLPFTIDITSFVKEESMELIVAVRDLSDTSYHARGKQKLKAGGMFYTAQSGIWQTVWMECVPENYIKQVLCIPLYDEKRVDFTVITKEKEPVEICIRGEEKKQSYGWTNSVISVSFDMIHAWSPEDPWLYDVTVSTKNDKIDTYFAMRVFSVEKNERGIPVLCLNHIPYYQKGILDQGYWSDGLYTPPSDAAMIYDIVKMKQLGFCMIRKHLKIESQRWYYHCDRLGMIVWQDMVNGGEAYHHWFVTYAATLFEQFGIHIGDKHAYLLSRRIKNGKREFCRDMKKTIQTLSMHPSIAVWVIFNEGWGQFETKRLTEMVRRLDPLRLIDSSSGWFDQGCGDFQSRHHYFFRLWFRKKDQRAKVLSEYGGYCLEIAGHTEKEKIYGYRFYTTIKAFCEAFDKKEKELEEVWKEQGLSAAVYTQLSDVEGEVNGILTYDRKVCKYVEKEKRDELCIR